MTATPSRRSVLGAAAAGTAAMAAATALPVPAQAAQTAAGSSATRLLSRNMNLHLVRRATYGPTPAVMKRIDKIGRRAWLEEQLAPSKVKDPAAAALMKHFPRLGWSVRQMWDADARHDYLRIGNYSGQVMQDLLSATIGRALWSNRQLFEQMVEFWSNHLNVTCPNGDVWDSRHLYDRGVIRRYALGKFRYMLLASSRHPSMLVYLNQADSNRYAPNENYARELLELHTVGVDGGYDEDDVYAAARLLTGLTLRNPHTDTPAWTRRVFFYDSRLHHTGGGRILGYSWPRNHRAADGMTYINGYLNHLARHRKTAEHIAFKLGQRFVSDSPPRKLVTHLADVYQANDTAIVPVLRALFTSAAFYGDGQKVRRPYEDVVAGLRAIGVRPSTNPDNPSSGSDYFEGLEAVYWQLRDLGHAPMGWAPPNGYPDTAKDWQSANGMLGRWNNHRSHAYGWWPSAGNKAFIWPAKPKVRGTDPKDLPLCRGLLPAKLPATYGGLVDALSLRLLHQKMRPSHRAAVTRYFGKTPSDVLRDTDAAVRWQMGDLVSLILDSPYHALR